MCGRYTLNQSAAAIAQAFHLQEIPDVAAQYNIAPTQYSANSATKPHKSAI